MFIFLVLLNKTSGVGLRRVGLLLPNFDVIVIFYLFVWFKNKLISQNNLFLFGLIIDTFDFLPLGMTSLVLLLSYEMIKTLKFYSINDDYLMYFLRDNIVFMLSFFILQWFFLSFYKNDFLTFGVVATNIVKNVIYSTLFYLFYKKFFEKNV
ncbi:MAG: hypothetical protein LBS34_03615 [Rickettsiales bacterium]|nr:hypothetical protein [Rickettsiales bacterium]